MSGVRQYIPSESFRILNEPPTSVDTPRLSNMCSDWFYSLISFDCYNTRIVAQAVIKNQPKIDENKREIISILTRLAFLFQLCFHW